MEHKIFILNNFKDSGIDKIKDIRDTAKLAGIKVSEYLYRYTKDQVRGMLESKDNDSEFKLNAFLIGLYEDLDHCDQIYWIHSDEVFEQLNRVIISRFIATKLIEQVNAGDIFKIINHFVIPDQVFTKEDYQFIDSCIVYSQYYNHWVKNGGLSVYGRGDYLEGNAPLIHAGDLSKKDIALIEESFGELEDFNLTLEPRLMVDNPPTIRSCNTLFYGNGDNSKLDIWLTILNIYYLDSGMIIYILSLVGDTALMRCMSNRVINLERTPEGFVEINPTQESEEVIDESNQENQ